MKSFTFGASLLLFVIAAAWPMRASAQSGRLWQNPLAQGNRLRSVAVASQETAIAVGELGTILRTTDGGTTWTIQDSGTTAQLSGVAFADVTTGVSVGYPGSGPGSSVILRTTDG